ncbi:MAG: right-handed parallel beta-helix repeat-containing protein [Candidatus Poribacteria bacterium]
MVFIDGDVIVPRGVSLKISHSTPQTIVHFSPESKLIIEGGLTVGAATFKQVLFTGVDDSQWGGLEIRANDKTCQIADSIFEFAQTPLTLLSAENVSVKNCEFRQNSIGIQGADGQLIDIAGCIFDGTETGITLQSIADVSVEICEFRGNQNAVVVVDGQQVAIGGVFRENGVGVEIQSSSKVEISGSILEQNKVGIRIIDHTPAQIRSSQFMENTVGVEIHSAQPISLRENSLIQNEVGIRVVSGAVDLGKAPDDLGRNNLLSNTVWNLSLETPSPDPILAQGNYWGELKSAEIDGTIRDDEEDADLPPVQFQPTLDEFQLVQAGWRVEFVGIQREGTQDSEGLANETVKKFPAGCQFLRYDAHFRVVNLDPRTPGFSVQPLLYFYSQRI